MTTQLRSEQTEFGGAWDSYTINFVNLTIGNGTATGYYKQIGKTVHVRVAVTLGSTSSVGTGVTVNLPVTSISYPTGSSVTAIGTAIYFESGVGAHLGQVAWSTTSRIKLWVIDSSGNYAPLTDVTSIKPFTWGTGDTISLEFTYEAA